MLDMPGLKNYSSVKKILIRIEIKKRSKLNWKNKR
jgi:hypothetical protein